jgi:2,4-dienoyl-CoA reductase-like NADH-dependent reductase (Old Yellow Enzyme family)
MSALLTSPMDIGALTLRNRMWLAPMCQYALTARDGVPHDWHLVHLGARAAGGFGLVIAEATAVSPEGRISPQDTGIWNDEQATAWARVVDFIHAQGAKAGIQLAHAGRKASTAPDLPGFPAGSVGPEDGGWQSVGPTDQAFPGLDAPRALSAEETEQVVRDFAAAARRAVDAGFDLIELHGAHGYLVHQFLTPLVNTRTDEYGGSFEGRSRLAREVTEAVREVLPEDRALTIRISGTDWTDGGWDVDSSIELVNTLAGLGLDAVHVSSGGAVLAKITPGPGPGYQSGLAQQIRAGVDVLVATVGLITEPEQAETLLRTGAADAVAIGRAALRDPHWALNATKALEKDASVAESLAPGHYARAYRG